MPVYFYTATDTYGCFSNFAPYGVVIDGRYWPTVEHYFQAMKFTDAAHQDRIARARTPKEAKALGLERKIPIRPDWDDIRDDIMRRAVLKKFQTHTEIKAILLSTGEDNLIESSPSDHYWGCGADGSGKNMLGHILMEVRDQLRDEG